MIRKMLIYQVCQFKALLSPKPSEDDHSDHYREKHIFMIEMLLLQLQRIATNALASINFSLMGKN